MSRGLKNIVLGVGSRAERYGLAFPRTQAFHIRELAEAPRLVAQLAPLGVVVTGEDFRELAECVVKLRQVAPEWTCLAVVHDPLTAQEIDILLQAGASWCAESWLAASSRFAQELKAVKRLRRGPAAPSSAPAGLQ